MNSVLTSLSSISNELFKSIEKEVYRVIDDIVVIKTSVFNKVPIKPIMDSDVIIIIANSLITFYFIYYIFTQLLSLYNGRRADNIFNFTIKIILVYIAVNNGYDIIKMVIELIEVFTNLIDNLLSSITKEPITFITLKDKIINMNNIEDTNLLSLNGIIKGIVYFGIVVVLINLSVRYVTILLLIIVFPLMFCFVSSDLTSGIFNSYIKMFFISIFTQILFKFILFIPLSYKDTNDIFFKIILVGSINLIYKINNLSKEIFSKFKSDNVRRNIFKNE